MRQGNQSLLALLILSTFVLSCVGSCALLWNTDSGGYVLTGVAAVFGLMLVLAFRDTVRRDRRRSTGRCLACGYDLRASPGRCPECGTAAGAREPRT